VIEDASVELWHLSDVATTIRIVSHTLMELRPTERASRCSLLVANLCGTNALGPIPPPPLPDSCDARSALRFRECFPEWPAT
jgi:hypothetical protein